MKKRLIMYTNYSSSEETDKSDGSNMSGEFDVQCESGDAKHKWLNMRKVTEEEYKTHLDTFIDENPIKINDRLVPLGPHHAHNDEIRKVSGRLRDMATHAR